MLQSKIEAAQLIKEKIEIVNTREYYEAKLQMLNDTYSRIGQPVPRELLEI